MRHLIPTLLARREAQMEEILFDLQVADDNGYRYSEDGRGEIRYLQHRKVAIRRSIERLTAWA